MVSVRVLWKFHSGIRYFKRGSGNALISAESLEGATTSFGGDNFVIPEIEVTNGTEIGEGPTFSAGVEGYQYFLARRTEVSGKMVTDAKREAAGAGEKQWWTELALATEYILSTQWGAGADGNTLLLYAPEVVITNIDPAGDGPIHRNTMDLAFQWVSGDDEVRLDLT